ncbi:MAG: AEC family transporter [Clostridiales Family XIII bacterium]|jgi:predicted permease|nr:AEC family transporter [Clostridiales Family XIII bacterium]
MPIGQFIVFFLLLLTGFFCKKYHVFTDAAVNAINKFIILIAYPCLILVRTTALDMDQRIFANFMLAAFVTLGLLLFLGAYAHLYGRARHFPAEDAPIAEFVIFSPNNGFMGFPIAFTFFGDIGLLYMVACNIALNTTFFTYGIALMKRGRRLPGESPLKKIAVFFSMLINPKVSAAIVGIVLCSNHVKLPGIALDYLDSVGAVATPLAMISIGTMLAGGFGLGSFRKPIVIECVLNKLVIVPLIAAAIVLFLPLDPLVKTILIVSNALPVATTAPILAEQYGRYKDFAGEALVITTIFSMATVPFAVWLLHHAGL